MEFSSSTGFNAGKLSSPVGKSLGKLTSPSSQLDVESLPRVHVHGANMLIITDIIISTDIKLDLKYNFLIKII